MKRLAVFVEGYTEEGFVNRLLAPHFKVIGIFLEPIILKTKKRDNAKDEKGGYITYYKIQKAIRELLNNYDNVTTMFDYYKLPKDFPGKDGIKGKTCYERVNFLEGRFQDDVESEKLIPYLSLHEFEALVLTSPEAIDRAFPNQGIQQEIEKITSKTESPEEINDDENTHPSARLIKIVDCYSKPYHGPLIANDIGLNAIRSKCPHFSQWLSKLECFAH